jgi:dystonin
MELIESHQEFCKDLHDQEELVEQCVTLGKDILADCIPESLPTLNHWLAVVQTKWSEVGRLARERTNRLHESLEQCRENEHMLDELLAWLQGAEATLTALEQKPVASELSAAEKAMKENNDFQADITSRQGHVERITKSSSIIREADLFPMASHSNTDTLSKKKPTTLKAIKQQQQNQHPSLQQHGASSSGWRTPEPKIRNPRVKLLFDRWRRVWLLSAERQRKLKELIERLKEMERLKNFSFDEWRRRYMNWHKDNRARITDFFRRQDRDHDGKISREEFIQGILSSSKYNFFFSNIPFCLDFQKTKHAKT